MVFSNVLRILSLLMLLFVVFSIGSIFISKLKLIALLVSFLRLFWQDFFGLRLPNGDLGDLGDFGCGEVLRRVSVKMGLGGEVLDFGRRGDLGTSTRGGTPTTPTFLLLEMIEGTPIILGISAGVDGGGVLSGGRETLDDVELGELGDLEGDLIGEFCNSSFVSAQIIYYVLKYDRCFDLEFKL